MGELLFKDVRKRYPGEPRDAVKNFNLEVEDGEFLVLVGPSGCGKSTLLRMVAGLIDITDGEIYIDGNLVNYIPPKERNIAMVFQNYALYPHLDVYENIAFGLRTRKVPKYQIHELVMRAARRLEIESQLRKIPANLSGGQRQRVAVGRAIVRDPEVFLMDEPLSNLDAKLRVQMREELTQLHRRLGTTTVYVTHDQVEAMTMGSRIVVMEQGVIQQVDTPEAIYNNPFNLFVAGFIGTPPMNFITGQIRSQSGEIGFYTERFMLKLPKEKREVLQEQDYVGADLILGVRAEDFILRNGAAASGSKGDQFETRVVLAEFMGSDLFIHVDNEDQKAVVRLNSNNRIREGDPVVLAVDMERAHFFDPKTGGKIC